MSEAVKFKDTLIIYVSFIGANNSLRKFGYIFRYKDGQEEPCAVWKEGEYGDLIPLGGKNEYPEFKANDIVSEYTVKQLFVDGTIIKNISWKLL